MSDEINFEFITTVKFRRQRCDSCHHWWGRESTLYCDAEVGCPYCGISTIRCLENERVTLLRRLSAMRGAITRLQRKLEKPVSRSNIKV